MSQHDQQCTPFRQNLDDLWHAIKAFPKGRIGHEAKNVLVELWRQATGKCLPKK